MAFVAMAETIHELANAIRLANSDGDIRLANTSALEALLMATTKAKHSLATFNLPAEWAASCEAYSGVSVLAEAVISVIDTLRHLFLKSMDDDTQRLGPVSAESFGELTPPAATISHHVRPVSRDIAQKRARSETVTLEHVASSELVTSCMQHPCSLSVGWSDLIGADHAIAALRQALLLPKKLPHFFTDNKFRQPPKCVLLYGPPGTGKTMLAAAAAKEVSAMLVSVSASDLLSKWVGSSERHIKELFDLKSMGQTLAPSDIPGETTKPSFAIIFLDEIDALCGSRGSLGESEAARRVKTEFLIRLQAFDASHGMVIAATNVPWELDPAFRRRFQKFIHVGLPNIAARVALVSRAVASFDPSEVDFGPDEVTRKATITAIAELLDGYSSAEVTTIVQQAFMAPLQLIESATTFTRLPHTEDCSSCQSYTQGAKPCRVHGWYPLTSNCHAVPAPAVTSRDLMTDEGAAFCFSEESIHPGVAKHRPSLLLLQRNHPKKKCNNSPFFTSNCRKTPSPFVLKSTKPPVPTVICFEGCYCDLPSTVESPGKCNTTEKVHISVCAPPVRFDDFREAIRTYPRSTNVDELKKYSSWENGDVY